MAETLLDRLTLFGNRLRVMASEADRKIADLKRKIEAAPDRYMNPDECSDWIAGDRRVLREELSDLEELSPACKAVAKHAADGFLFMHPRFVASGELYHEVPGYDDLLLDCQNLGCIVFEDQRIADVSRDAANTSYGRS